MSGVHLVDGLPDNGGEFTKGLRVLADVLDESSSARYYDDYRHFIAVWGRDALVETVRRIGGYWTKDEKSDEYFGMTRNLGGGVTIHVYCAREAVCSPVVVGTRKVTRPAENAPMVEVVEDVIEWQCPESLLEAGS